MMELEQLNFGFERTNIEPQSKKPLLNYSSNRLKHHLIEHHKYRLKRVHLLVIKLKHPAFGFERSNIELSNIIRPIRIFLNLNFFKISRKMMMMMTMKNTLQMMKTAVVKILLIQPLMKESTQVHLVVVSSNSLLTFLYFQIYQNMPFVLERGLQNF